ncbi:NAD(P)/FAD-dependent oxidoreductase [Salinimicrobium sp. TH3]|uniref:NAD(P)/FAD-dependent oxidoreductase n=1 Tax=Salinimicrobium sp. TH3 TaxID=2997342 RepID=UPI002276DE65|nr:FAD-dependent oxidoreductase [Salinimicrobium sp. TH3]MCY2686469.1 FAD-dependent oxidoreductase [Salinimicrobium sp. TH3]
MSFSYWEHDSWFSNIDFTIVGSGITGLNCALELKTRYPKAKIVVLERGLLPNGASTKNAGFACFGSLSEILDDLEHHSEEEMVALVRKRMQGLDLLRENLGSENIDLQVNGGYELFTQNEGKLFDTCVSKMAKVNTLLNPIFGEDVFSITNNKFGFGKVQDNLIFNKFEGQLDTGKMMNALLQKVHAAGVKILNSVTVNGFVEGRDSVEVETEHFSFYTGNLLIATNGFAAQLGIPEVKPARAQVLITEPIPDLHIKGTFHLEKGYYYFRNINNRILLGGGRNLNIKGEETTELALTALIQQRLEGLLKNTILPGTPFRIERRWSGIMGVGEQKKPVIKKVSKNVFCGVRLGGMGVAIGSLVGKELADLID